MSRFRQTGSAHGGLGEWVLQRLSAIYMAGFVVVLSLRWIAAPVCGYGMWKQWMAGIALRVSATLFFASAVIHVWIGVRSVFMDYLHPSRLRLTATIVTAMALAAILAWSIGVLWGVAG